MLFLLYYIYYFLFFESKSNLSIKNVKQYIIHFHKLIKNISQKIIKILNFKK